MFASECKRCRKRGVQGSRLPLSQRRPSRLAPQRSAVETKPPSFGELGPDASQVITTGITTPDRTRLPRQGGRMLGNYEQSITYFELLQRKNIPNPLTFTWCPLTVTAYFSKYGAQMGLALEPGHSPDNNHSGAAVKARDGQDGHLTREQDPALRVSQDVRSPMERPPNGCSPTGEILSETVQQDPCRCEEEHPTYLFPLSGFTSGSIPPTACRCRDRRQQMASKASSKLCLLQPPQPLLELSPHPPFPIRALLGSAMYESILCRGVSDEITYKSAVEGPLVVTRSRGEKTNDHYVC